MNKAKIHATYRTADGTRVPSVTTVLHELAKPALIHWAWGLGIKGIDYRVYRDELADVGTLAHSLIMAHLKKETPSLDDYSQNQIDLAENSFLKFLEWERQHSLEPIALERPMVSEIFKFGGTPDYFGLVDGILTILDFKTGKEIYEDYWYQIGGYDILVKETFSIEEIAGYRILNIGRDESENFEEKQKLSVSRERDLFLAALRIYELKKEIRNECRA